MTALNSLFYFQNSLRCTLVITQKCNLSCAYCYADKKNASMPLQTAQGIIGFLFDKTSSQNTVDIGFFGGEPLLEFQLMKQIIKLMQSHPNYKVPKIKLSVTTNGTLLTQEIIEYLSAQQIALCISCDGPSSVQDFSRNFANGKGTSELVEKNIKLALKIMPTTAVNAVYSPHNLEFLPQTVDYFLSLGLREIHLSPNIVAKWTQKDAEKLPHIFEEVANRYINTYRQDRPAYINLIDSKIAVIFQGGYKARDRCKMGKGEYAFAPSGNIYPCERLVGSDDGVSHCLGNIHGQLSFGKMCEGVISNAKNTECAECTLKEYCMNWCGCTNYHGTGRYNYVSAFTCASEKAAISSAYNVIQKMGPSWIPLVAHQNIF